jgi:Hint domain
MKKLQRIRTRRQLLRVMAAGTASIPFLALTRNTASAQIPSDPKIPLPSDPKIPLPSGPKQPTTCLLKGTKISTPSGDRLVQELRIGDEVQTLAGRKTIKWIGYNKFTKEEGRAWHDNVMPIRVGRFAIDDQTPYRDLYLSPLHCVFFNEALIPVMYLINETSIAQGTPSEMSALEYYHVALDTHEVIYAEGALSKVTMVRAATISQISCNTSDLMGPSVNPR